VHHEGDLLTQDAAARIGRFFPAQEVILRARPDGTRPPPRWIQAKAAVHQLTKSLAAEWAPHGVRVNALAPGYTKTEMAPVDRPEFRARWIDDAPMQRYAMPQEYGPALVFLASGASSFMTGATLVVDGG
jgi:NAD(P)-dependent dehydrogenase (short-subunit alcohol dehydrogenase family)